MRETSFGTGAIPCPSVVRNRSSSSLMLGIVGGLGWRGWLTLGHCKEHFPCPGMAFSGPQRKGSTFLALFLMRKRGDVPP